MKNIFSIFYPTVKSVVADIEDAVETLAGIAEQQSRLASEYSEAAQVAQNESDRATRVATKLADIVR